MKGRSVSERLFQADFPGMCVSMFEAVVMTRLHAQCFCNRSYFFPTTQPGSIFNLERILCCNDVVAAFPVLKKRCLWWGEINE